MGRLNQQQKSRLIELVQENQNILLKRKTQHGRDRKNNKWSEIAEILNNMRGGEQRDVAGWKKCFSGMKVTLKKKINTLRQRRQTTGAGRLDSDLELSGDDLILDSLMGTAGDGHPEIGELGHGSRTNTSFSTNVLPGDICSDSPTVNALEERSSPPCGFTLSPPTLHFYGSPTHSEMHSDDTNSEQGYGACQSSHGPLVTEMQVQPTSSQGPSVSGTQAHPPSFQLPFVLGSQVQPTSSQGPSVSGTQAHPPSSQRPFVSGTQAHPPSFQLPFVLGSQVQPTSSQRPSVSGTQAHSTSSQRPSGAENQAHPTSQMPSRTRARIAAQSRSRQRGLTMTAVERNLEMANTTNQLLARFVAAQERSTINQERLINAFIDFVGGERDNANDQDQQNEESDFLN